MQKIIEDRLKSWYMEGKDFVTERDLCNIAYLIASDIQKEWKVIARGKLQITGYDISVLDDSEIIYIDTDEFWKEYHGKTIEIAVRILDETKE
jgi:hypothetical protein